MQVSMTVNGEPVSAEVEPRLLLVHFLRDHLGLTGTHWGCDTSNCGTCVVEVDGYPVKSCTMLAAMASGRDALRDERNRLPSAQLIAVERVVRRAAEPAGWTILRAGRGYGLEEEHRSRWTRVELRVITKREIRHRDDALLDAIEVDANRLARGRALSVRHRVRGLRARRIRALLDLRRR